MNKHLYTNPLIHEKSPYFLQHAHNPVDWNPWGEEPFKIARGKSLPLLAGRQIKNGKTTAWVCKLGTCLSPVTSPEELTSLLNYEEN